MHSSFDQGKSIYSCIRTYGGSAENYWCCYPQGGIRFMRPFPESPKFSWMSWIACMSDWEIKPIPAGALHHHEIAYSSIRHLTRTNCCYRTLLSTLEVLMSGTLAWKTLSQGWRLAFQMSQWGNAYTSQPLIFLWIYLGIFVALHHSW